MNRHTALAGCIFALTLGLASAAALADDDCDVPIERWQSRAAVEQMATQKGWEIQRLKIDDGCYEIRGKDAQGRSFKAKIDPETLDVVKLKYQDRDRERNRDRDDHDDDDSRDRGIPGAQPPDDRPLGTPHSGDKTLFTPGTAPRGQVE